jgi:hypothetical protein
MMTFRLVAGRVVLYRMPAVYRNRLYALLDWDSIVRVCKEDLVSLISRCVYCMQFSLNENQNLNVFKLASPG